MFKSISGKIKGDKPKQSRGFFDGEPEETKEPGTKPRGFLNKLLSREPEQSEEVEQLLAFVRQLEDPSLGEYQRSRIINIIRLRCRRDPDLVELFPDIAAMNGIGAHSPFAKMPMPKPFNR